MKLHGVEGHTVVFADGRRLGRVAWMEYESRTDQPDALIVRRRFYERPGLVRLPAEIVASVERDERIVRLDIPLQPQSLLLAAAHRAVAARPLSHR